MKTEHEIFEHYKAWRLSIGITEPPCEEAYRCIRDSVQTVEEQEAQNRLESLMGTGENEEIIIYTDEDGNEIEDIPDEYRREEEALQAEEPDEGLDNFNPNEVSYLPPSEEWWTELLSHPYQFATKQWWGEMARIGKTPRLLESWVRRATSKKYIQENGVDPRIPAALRKLDVFQDPLLRLNNCL